MSPTNICLQQCRPKPVRMRLVHLEVTSTDRRVAVVRSCNCRICGGAFCSWHRSLVANVNSRRRLSSILLRSQWRGLGNTRNSRERPSATPSAGPSAPCYAVVGVVRAWLWWPHNCVLFFVRGLPQPEFSFGSFQVAGESDRRSCFSVSTDC